MINFSYQWLFDVLQKFLPRITKNRSELAPCGCQVCHTLLGSWNTDNTSNNGNRHLINSLKFIMRRKMFLRHYNTTNINTKNNSFSTSIYWHTRYFSSVTKSTLDPLWILSKSSISWYCEYCENWSVKQIFPVSVTKTTYGLRSNQQNAVQKF